MKKEINISMSYKEPKPYYLKNPSPEKTLKEISIIANMKSVDAGSKVTAIRAILERAGYDD